MEKFLDTPVKRYSSGMYVRLAFAVAAHLEPEILIVDEVLAVGDAEFQKKCLGKMHEVGKREGRTILFVSHNLGVVRNLCKEACWLELGRVRQIGQVIEVTEGYLRQNGNTVGRTVELTDVKRTQNYGQLLRIDKLEWQPDPPLVHDGATGVRVQFTALADINDLSVSIGFSSLDGTRLLTYESDLYGLRRNLNKGQCGLCKFHIDALPLTPGHYMLDIGARSGDLHGVDYLSGLRTRSGNS